MIRIFCDWCKKEVVGSGMGGAFGRRVQLQYMNVCFTFEFSGEAKPEHICIPCAVDKIQNAIVQLQTETLKEATDIING